ncbi:MAG: glycosyltransferase family 2 protein [Flavobacteriales bacterium]|jgi:glycosyltransferase involved in cell wall biosynthesis|nr:glycosyltransferase family 2 protein [Flavobacteriales bacterium]
MSSTPEVSIIIAARDYGEHLPTALASVSAQTLQDWECIIVDDASGDETPRIVAEAVAKDRRFRSIRLDANVGVSAARNRGIAAAQGRYVQFLDADDAIAPEKLARQAALLDMDADAAIVCSNFTHFTAAPDFTKPGEYRADEKLHGSGYAVVHRLLKGNVIRLNTALVRATAVRSVGGFREQFRAVEDWHLWLMLAGMGHRFAFLDDAACHSAVRVNPRGLSKDGPGMRRWYLPVLQDLWAHGCLSFILRMEVLVRYADFLLELRLIKREPAILLPLRRNAFLLQLVPITLALCPFWLVARPFRR